MKTSWQPVSKWYNENVGTEGHYYHQTVILPKILEFLKGSSAVLDLACGNGILGRKLPKTVDYEGYDISSNLIRAAKTQDKSPKHSYFVQDCTKPIKSSLPFDSAVSLLALQNIENPKKLFENAFNLLEAGDFHIVMNHPCFRIPRQSSWGADQEKKIQYRRLDRYMSPMNIPIHAHPSRQEKSAETISFHHPLSYYINLLAETGFYITGMEEWISPKESTGKNAKQENRAREEFPLFLYLKASKLK